MAPNSSRMTLSQADAQAAASACSAATGELLDDGRPRPNVVGVGAGVKWRNGEPTGEPAVVVLVTHKVAKAQLAKAEVVPAKVQNMQTDVLAVDWGQANKAEDLAEALRRSEYDAVAVVMNETSTGVRNPIEQYAEILADYPDTLFLVDVVSSYMGEKILVDEWGIDVCLTSTQKAFALPPGMALGAVSPAVLERARQVENRGYYFDVLEIDRHHQKNNTPATPPIALMYAADRQLDDILSEGLDNRFARHERMQQMTHEWVRRAGFELYSEDGYHSRTVSNVRNTRGIDVVALNNFLKDRGMMISNGYGKLKGQAFRIAHMGDTQPAHLEELFAAMDDFLAQAG